MAWLGQLFVSPLVSFCLPTCFLTRLLGWVLSRDGLARSALCLPSCFLTRLLGWKLSRDGLARSALCLPTCFRTRLLGWKLSRDGLARSALCLPTCSHLSLDLFRHGLAGLDAGTRWSGSVSSLSPHLFPFDAVTRWSGSSPLSPHLFAFVPLVSSRACWAGCCHEMVWLGQLFVSPLLSVFLPTCFLTRLLGWMLSRDGLARSALCLPTCVHLSPHLFPHPLAGLDAVTRWSGSVSSLSPHSFPCFSPRVSSLACWAGCCHEMVWLGQPLIPPLVCICLPCFLTRLLGWMLSRDGLARSALCLPTPFRVSPHVFPHSLAGLDAVTRWSGSVSP